MLLGGLYFYYYPSIDVVIQGNKRTVILWYDTQDDGIIRRNYKKLFEI
jgi:hypothetical protein